MIGFVLKYRDPDDNANGEDYAPIYIAKRTLGASTGANGTGRTMRLETADRHNAISTLRYFNTMILSNIESYKALFQRVLGIVGYNADADNFRQKYSSPHFKDAIKRYRSMMSGQTNTLDNLYVFGLEKPKKEKRGPKFKKKTDPKTNYVTPDYSTERINRSDNKVMFKTKTNGWVQHPGAFNQHTRNVALFSAYKQNLINFITKVVSILRQSDFSELITSYVNDHKYSFVRRDVMAAKKSGFMKQKSTKPETDNDEMLSSFYVDPRIYVNKTTKPFITSSDCDDYLSSRIYEITKTMMDNKDFNSIVNDPNNLFSRIISLLRYPDYIFTDKEWSFVQKYVRCICDFCDELKQLGVIGVLKGISFDGDAIELDLKKLGDLWEYFVNVKDKNDIFLAELPKKTDSEREQYIREGAYVRDLNIVYDALKADAKNEWESSIKFEKRQENVGGAQYCRFVESIFEKNGSKSGSASSNLISDQVAALSEGSRGSDADSKILSKATTITSTGSASTNAKNVFDENECIALDVENVFKGSNIGKSPITQTNIVIYIEDPRLLSNRFDELSLSKGKSKIDIKNDVELLKKWRDRVCMYTYSSEQLRTLLSMVEFVTGNVNKDGRVSHTYVLPSSEDVFDGENYLDRDLATMLQLIEDTYFGNVSISGGTSNLTTFEDNMFAFNESDRASILKDIIFNSLNDIGANVTDSIRSSVNLYLKNRDPDTIKEVTEELRNRGISTDVDSAIVKAVQNRAKSFSDSLDSIHQLSKRLTLDIDALKALCNNLYAQNIRKDVFSKLDHPDNVYTYLKTLAEELKLWSIKYGNSHLTSMMRSYLENLRDNIERGNNSYEARYYAEMVPLVWKVNRV